jgi:hypothetical protein
MIYVLRLVHIISGVFWVGSVMFTSLLLAPTLRALGPGAGPVMNQLVKVRKLPMVMMASALLTVGAGLWLFLIDMNVSDGAFMRSRSGQTFSAGAVFAILAFVLGMAVNAPTAKRIGAISAAVAARGGPPNAEEQAEMQRLNGRMTTASQIVMVLLILATGAMAIARYVP